MTDDFSKLVFPVIGGSMLLIFCWLRIRDHFEFRKLETGAVTDGRLIKKEIEKDEGTFYYVTYTFRDSFRSQYTNRVQVAKRYFESLSEGPVKVVYQPDNPQNSFLHGSRMSEEFNAKFKGMPIVVGVLTVCILGYVFQEVFKPSA